MEPQPFTLMRGVSYPIELRATPDHGPDGESAPGQTMWSADLVVARDSGGFTASAATPAAALKRLAAVIAKAPRG